MNILFLSSVFPRPDSIVRGIYNSHLCETLARSHRVDVVAPWHWWARAKWQLNGWKARSPVVCSGIEVRRPPYYYPPRVLRNSFDWFMWRSAKHGVKAIARTRKPDFILSYWTYPDGGAALLAGQALSAPVVLIVGGSDVLIELKKPTRRAAFLKVLRGVDLIVAVSQDIRERLFQEGIPERKVAVNPRGIDLVKFSPGCRQQERRTLNLPLDKRVLLWIGNMVPVKGLDILLSALETLSRQIPDIHLALVGTGPLKGWLREEVSKRRLAHLVTVAGTVSHDKLPPWFRSADLTVLPSRSEGTPNVLMESIACGTPFVASRVGGIPDIATEPIDRLVPPGDSNALAKAIRERLESGEYQKPRSFLPRSWENAASALIEAAEPILAGRSSLSESFEERRTAG